jgi:hypothetical protein
MYVRMGKHYIKKVSQVVKIGIAPVSAIKALQGENI